MPRQKGKIIELKDHQEEVVSNLKEMRDKGDSIALLYHARGARVIIMMGAINVFNKNNSCITWSD